MLAKIIVTSNNRSLAIAEMQNMLNKTVVQGIETNKALLTRILSEHDFLKADIHTTWCDDIAKKMATEGKAQTEDVTEFVVGYILNKTKEFKQEVNHTSSSSLWKSVGYWRNYCRMHILVGDKPYFVQWRFEHNNQLALVIEEKNHQFFYERITDNESRIFVNDKWKLLNTSASNDKRCYVSVDGITLTISENLKSFKKSKTKQQVNGLHSSIVSPLPGKVIKIHTPVGTQVKKGDALLIIESMKMENKVVAVADSTIKKVLVVEGQQLEGSEVLLELEHKIHSN